MAHTMTRKTTLLACVAVAALQAGAVAAQSADDTLAWLKQVAGSDEVTIGSVRSGAELQLRDVTLQGGSQILSIDTLTFPEGLSSESFVATGLLTRDIQGRIGGAAASVLSGDIQLISGLIENSLFVLPCTGAARESQLHAENVSFWSDLDMKGAARTTEEMSQVALIDAQILLGDNCSEINVADVNGIASRGIGGATGYISSATWVSNPGRDKVIQASVSDFRAVSAAGSEILSIAAADIGIAPSVAIAELFTGPSMTSGILRELSQGSFSFDLRGVLGDLSKIVPPARDGGFDVPAGHTIDGDISLTSQGGAVTQIAGTVLMAGIGDFRINAGVTIDQADGVAASVADAAARVRLSYADISIADDGLDALVEQATGTSVPGHVSAGLAAAASSLPAVPGNPIAPIVRHVSDWVMDAFANGGHVALTPDAPVSMMEVGLSAMGGTTRLAQKLNLETGPAR